MPRAATRLASTAALMLALAVGISGCGTDRMTTGSIARMPASSLAAMSSAQVHDASVTLGRTYASNPGDKTIAMRYATLLQMGGDASQSLAVVRKLAIANPKDREVLSAYGKALAANGQFEPALDAVRRAQTPEYPDWRLMSAEGAILDQLGQKNEARQRYRKALELKPNEPSVLSNLGMSYLLDGDLRSAEIYMRNAAKQPGADSRVRQNLALVVGLQGRFAEAEKIAVQELPPAQAEANIAYLRAMLSQQNAWNQIKAQDKKKATN